MGSIRVAHGTFCPVKMMSAMVSSSLGATLPPFALIAWVLFAAVLLLRLAAGWRGRRAAIGTIVGFLCTAAVLVSYMVRAQGGPS